MVTVSFGFKNVKWRVYRFRSETRALATSYSGVRGYDFDSVKTSFDDSFLWY